MNSIHTILCSNGILIYKPYNKTVRCSIKRNIYHYLTACRVTLQLFLKSMIVTTPERYTLLDIWHNIGSNNMLINMIYQETL